MSTSAAHAHDDAAPHTLLEIVEHAAHLLPAQAPLHAFVHHNTLHAFEHLPFDQAVLEGAQRFGTEPLPTEAWFGHHLRRGRIQEIDLAAVVEREYGHEREPVFPGGPSVHDFTLARLHDLFEIPRGSMLRWVLTETEVVRRLRPELSPTRRERLLALAETYVGGPKPGSREGDLEQRLLARLWADLEGAAPLSAPASDRVRPRDRLVAEHHIDPDAWVHPVLIRLCAAFLDQGVAYWSMPGREHGFLAAFRRLYGLAFGPPQRFMHGLPETLRKQEAEGWDAERTITWALETLQIPSDAWPVCIEHTLLSLRGWAGMMRQFELRPDRAPVRAPTTRLLDYLAVQLTLDVFAARHAAAEALGPHATLADLAAARTSEPERTPPLELVYEALMLAERQDVDPNAFAVIDHARAWLALVQRIGDNERRRLLLLAYERRHCVSVLDTLAAHGEAYGIGARPRSRFQAMFCMDDREESMRRHLEEVFPAVETFGIAGFFGVAMAYQGVNDPRPRPLCPAIVRPRHLVVEREIASPSTAERSPAVPRRSGRLARLSHGLRVANRNTLARGTVIAAMLGLSAVVPLIGRVLFPRLFERWSRTTLRRVAPPPATRLAIERDDPTAEPHGDLLRGYTVPEMADVVQGVLGTLGLPAADCTLVVVIGHGSSSLNNPHEAAYDCGATGGGRGGPNARAFAAMANHPEVRAELRARGHALPEHAWFIGAQHNTCDDSIAYYDEDLVPAGVRAELTTAQEALAQACLLDAQERCRRFESASPRIEPEAALAHVEGRAADLAQPRPELGHATNAVCIIGRRQRTRGLFLDRRAFLVSYDPTRDPDGSVLGRLLEAVGPVGAGINLEYFFSYVDPAGYGCGSKLPHNIVGLFGVMDGHASDLRTGLPWQMVEVHEPVRLLAVIEGEPEKVQKVIAARPAVAQLVFGGWIRLAVLDPDGNDLYVFERGAFVRYVPESTQLPIVERSLQHFRSAGVGAWDHLGGARVKAATAEVVSRPIRA